MASAIATKEVVDYGVSFIMRIATIPLEQMHIPNFCL